MCGARRGGPCREGEAWLGRMLGRMGTSRESDSFLHSPASPGLFPCPSLRRSQPQGSVPSPRLRSSERLHSTRAYPCFALGVGPQHPPKGPAGPGGGGPASLSEYPLGLLTKPLSAPGPLHVQLPTSWRPPPTPQPFSQLSSNVTASDSFPDHPNVHELHVPFSGFWIHLCTYCLGIPLEGEAQEGKDSACLSPH